MAQNNFIETKEGKVSKKEAFMPTAVQQSRETAEGSLEIQRSNEDFPEQFGSVIKNLPATWDTWLQSLGWEDPLEEGMATHSVLLPGESQGQRSLVDYIGSQRVKSD